MVEKLIKMSSQEENFEMSGFRVYVRKVVSTFRELLQE